MLTNLRIREILHENGLDQNQLDDVAAYCYTVQPEMTEQDVHDIATHLTNKVDHAD